MQPTVGILSFQGDFQKHASVCERIGYRTVAVRNSDALTVIDALIIPGGESTTIGMLIDRFGLLPVIRARIADGLPVMGTCAGTILLADTIEGSDQVRIGGMDIVVRRNAYGRQVDSFEERIPIPLVGREPVECVFIRAPAIISAGAGVDVFASYGGNPIMVRQKNLLTLTFHPELTGDDRIHRYFLENVR